MYGKCVICAQEYTQHTVCSDRGMEMRDMYNIMSPINDYSSLNAYAINWAANKSDTFHWMHIEIGHANERAKRSILYCIIYMGIREWRLPFGFVISMTFDKWCRWLAILPRGLELLLNRWQCTIVSPTNSKMTICRRILRQFSLRNSKIFNFVLWFNSTTTELTFQSTEFQKFRIDRKCTQFGRLNAVSNCVFDNFSTIFIAVGSNGPNVVTLFRFNSASLIECCLIEQNVHFGNDRIIFSVDKLLRERSMSKLCENGWKVNQNEEHTFGNCPHRFRHILEYDSTHRPLSLLFAMPSYRIRVCPLLAIQTIRLNSLV